MTITHTASLRDGSGRRPSRSSRALLGARRKRAFVGVILRLLALLVSTELSGAAHAVLDVTASLTGAEHPDDDCDAEAGHECPPGCTNCHCTHGAVAWATPRVATLAHLNEIQPALREAGFVPRDAMPPAGPDLTPLYRPPRAIALS